VLVPLGSLLMVKLDLVRSNPVHDNVLLVWSGSGALVAVLLLLAGWQTSRRVAAVAANVPRDSWVADCASPDPGGGQRVLVLSAAGVDIYGRLGRLQQSLRYHELIDVTVERIPVAVVRHWALVLHPRVGRRIELLLPARSMFFFPVRLPREARAEILARQRASDVVAGPALSSE
jgi:hypothetical protein